MLSARLALPAVAAAMLAAQSASGEIVVRTFFITNDTSEDWSGMMFGIVPHPTEQYTEAKPFDSIVFLPDMDSHESSKLVESVTLVDPQRLMFGFFADDPIEPGDGPVAFSVWIDNPHKLKFNIAWEPQTVPAPGAATLLAAGGLLAARRRRR